MVKQIPIVFRINDGNKHEKIFHYKDEDSIGSVKERIFQTVNISQSDYDIVVKYCEKGGHGEPIPTSDAWLFSDLTNIENLHVLFTTKKTAEALEYDQTREFTLRLGREITAYRYDSKNENRARIKEFICSPLTGEFRIPCSQADFNKFDTTSQQSLRVVEQPCKIWYFEKIIQPDVKFDKLNSSSNTNESDENDQLWNSIIANKIETFFNCFENKSYFTYCRNRRTRSNSSETDTTCSKQDSSTQYWNSFLSIGQEKRNAEDLQLAKADLITQDCTIGADFLICYAAAGDLFQLFFLEEKHTLDGKLVRQLERICEPLDLSNMNGRLQAEIMILRICQLQNNETKKIYTPCTENIVKKFAKINCLDHAKVTKIVERFGKNKKTGALEENPNYKNAVDIWTIVSNRLVRNCVQVNKIATNFHKNIEISTTIVMDKYSHYIPQTVGELKKAIGDVLIGLESLHLHNYAHCDLRWPNVLYDYYNKYLLADFDNGVLLGSRVTKWYAHYPKYMKKKSRQSSSESTVKDHSIDFIYTVHEDYYQVGSILIAKSRLTDQDKAKFDKLRNALESSHEMIHNIYYFHNLLNQIIEHEWYQTEEMVVVSVIVKNMRAEDFMIEWSEHQLKLESTTISVKIDLSHAIDPQQSNFSFLPTKIEIELAKASFVTWQNLGIQIEKKMSILS